jgi:hypothetical protein
MKIYILKESKQLIIFILLGFLACSANKNKIVFEPAFEHLIELFINDNEDLDPSQNVIILNIEDIGANEFIISIMSEMIENVPFNFINYKEAICSGYNQQFRIFVVGNSQRVLKGECIEYILSKNMYSSEYAPISYNGALWILKIQDSKILDFSYKFCKPDNNLIEQLKLIPLNLP